MYGSAKKLYLQMPDTIHHHGLRLPSGACRRASVGSFHTEAGDPSLYLRHKQNSILFNMLISFLQMMTHMQGKQYMSSQITLKQ